MSKSPSATAGSKLGIGRTGISSTSGKDDTSENKTTSLDLGKIYELSYIAYL